MSVDEATAVIRVNRVIIGLPHNTTNIIFPLWWKIFDYFTVW